MKKILLPLFLLTSSLMAQEIQFQNIRVGGLGCPTETTSIVMAPDQSSASLIFNQFESRVPQTVTSPKVSRNIHIINCNIFVDIKLPQGVKLEAVDIAYDMRGLANLDRGVLGNFKSVLVDRVGPGIPNTRQAEILHEKVWANTFAAQDEDFIIQSTKRLPLNSQCAVGSANDIVSIRLQNTLTSQILAGFENVSQGMIIVDSSDFRGGLRLSAATSRCAIGRPNIPPSPPTTNPGRNCRVVIINGRATQVCR